MVRPHPGIAGATRFVKLRKEGACLTLRSLLHKLQRSVGPAEQSLVKSSENGWHQQMQTLVEKRIQPEQRGHRFFMMKPYSTGVMGHISSLLPNIRT